MITSRPQSGGRSRAWPAVLVLGSVGFLLVAHRLLTGLLSASGAETARDEVLGTEVPAVLRELESANLDPENPGPASAAWLAGHFARNGGTVLGSAGTPGRPTSATVDVLLVRTAEGHALGQTTEAESVTVCLRFTTAAEQSWSGSPGVRTTAKEIDCQVR